MKKRSVYYLVSFLFLSTISGYSYAAEKPSMLAKAKQTVQSVADKIKQFFTHRYTNKAITGFCVSFLGYGVGHASWEMARPEREFNIMQRKFWKAFPKASNTTLFNSLIPIALKLKEKNIPRVREIIKLDPKSREDLRWALSSDPFFSRQGSQQNIYVSDTYQNPIPRFFASLYHDKQMKDVTDGDMQNLLNVLTIREAEVEELPQVPELLEAPYKEAQVKERWKESFKSTSPYLKKGITTFCVGWLGVKMAKKVVKNVQGYRKVVALCKKYYGPSFQNSRLLEVNAMLGTFYSPEIYLPVDQIVYLAYQFLLGGFDQLMKKYGNGSLYLDYTKDLLREYPFFFVLAELHYGHKPTEKESETFLKIFEEKTNLFYPRKN